MAKFHVNSKGEAGACGATKGKCPFGGDDAHYTTESAARAAFEAAQEAPAKLTKKPRILIPEEFKTPPTTREAMDKALQLVPDVNDSKIIVPPAIADQNGYMGGSRFVGGKVGDKYMSSTDVGKELRAMVTEAKKIGELPKWVNVSIKKSGGSGFYAFISMKKAGATKAEEMPYDLIYLPKLDPEDRWERARLTPGAQRLENYIVALTNVYKSSDTNPMVDYFNSSHGTLVQWR